MKTSWGPRSGCLPERFQQLDAPVANVVDLDDAHAGHVPRPAPNPLGQQGVQLRLGLVLEQARQVERPDGDRGRALLPQALDRVEPVRRARPRLGNVVNVLPHALEREGFAARVGVARVQAVVVAAAGHLRLVVLHPVRDGHDGGAPVAPCAPQRRGVTSMEKFT